MALIIGRICLPTGAAVLIVAGGVSGRVAGKMGGYSNKMGVATVRFIIIVQDHGTNIRLTYNSPAQCETETFYTADKVHTIWVTGKSTSGINEEIIWISISMAIAIAVLIAIALCYILKEKCTKKQAYREQS